MTKIILHNAGQVKYPGIQIWVGERKIGTLHDAYRDTKWKWYHSKDKNTLYDTKQQAAIALAVIVLGEDDYEVSPREVK